MEYLARLNIVAMLMSTTFWINLAVVFFVTLITYWLINWLLNVVYKALQRPDKKDDAHGRLRPIVFEMLKKTSKMLIFFAAFLFSLRFVALPDRLFSTLSHAWFLVVAIQMAIWLDQGVQSWMRHLLYAPGSNKNPVTLVILGMILRVLVWSMMLLSILANVGVDITALVASLGVGGIAIALAVQTVLSDVFASLSIGFDKPFEIGDFVVFNDVAGTIEHIGLKPPASVASAANRSFVQTRSCCSKPYTTISGCKRVVSCLLLASPLRHRRKSYASSAIW